MEQAAPDTVSDLCSQKSIQEIVSKPDSDDSDFAHDFTPDVTPDLTPDSPSNSSPSLTLTRPTSQSGPITVTRARIRRRKVANTDKNSSRNKELNQPEDDELAGEESHWMKMSLDEVIPEDEVQKISETIWTPHGKDLPFDLIRTKLDYRKTWDIGYIGAKILYRNSRKTVRTSILEAVSGRRNSIYFHAFFDGTDPVRFFHLRHARPNSRTPKTTLLRKMIEKQYSLLPRVYPVSVFLNAEFSRSMGTIKVPLLDNDDVYSSFVFVKSTFMDALIYCIWQIQVRTEVERLTIARVSEMFEKQRTSDERRREKSRARRATATVSSSNRPSGASVPSESDSVVLSYDPSPGRARLSSFLFKPSVPHSRMRRSA